MSASHALAASWKAMLSLSAARKAAAHSGEGKCMSAPVGAYL